MFWGILSVVLGLFAIWVTRKYPAKGRDIFLRDYQGYVGGVGLIFVGLWILLEYLQKHL